MEDLGELAAGLVELGLDLGGERPGGSCATSSSWTSPGSLRSARSGTVGQRFAPDLLVQVIAGADRDGAMRTDVSADQLGDDVEQLRGHRDSLTSSRFKEIRVPGGFRFTCEGVPPRGRGMCRYAASIQGNAGVNTSILGGYPEKLKAWGAKDLRCLP